MFEETVRHRRRVLDHYGGSQTGYTFRSGLNECGVSMLDPQLTLNSATVTPTVRYYGGDASAGGWAAATYGDALSTASSGDAPTYNDGSPAVGPLKGTNNDDSILFNGGVVFNAAASTTGDITTEDIVVELVFRATSSGNTELIVDKEDNASPFHGWRVSILNTGNLQFRTFQAGSVLTTSGALSAGAWYHAMCFVDRDEASANSSRWNVNGSASGAGANHSSNSATLTNAKLFTIGAAENFTLKSTSNVAYFAMWSQASWLEGGAGGVTAFDALALDRFLRFQGLIPRKAAGTATPTVYSRATTATLDNESGAARKMYLVGADWLRICSRQDTSGDDNTGYLSEPASTNLCLRSGALDNASWTKVGSTVNADSASGPGDVFDLDGIVTADAVTDTQHGVTQDVTLTATTYIISCWAKAGAQDFLYLSDQTLTNGWAYFNLSTGAAGNTGADVGSSGIENWGGGIYRCWITVTGTAAAHTIAIYASDQDDNAKDPAFVGDGASDEILAAGAQVELYTSYPSSYVPTAGATVTRNKDQLRYKGDDGNLGGVGSDQRGSIDLNIMLPNSDSVGQYALSISDGGASADRIDVVSASGEGATIDVRATGGSSGDVDGTTDVSDGDLHRIKTTYQANRLTLAVDGAADGTTDTDVAIPDALDQIEVGATWAAGSQLRGLVSDIKIRRQPR